MSYHAEVHQISDAEEDVIDVDHSRTAHVEQDDVTLQAMLVEHAALIDADKETCFLKVDVESLAHLQG